MAATSSTVKARVFRGRIWSLIRSIGAAPPESRTSVAPLSMATLSSFSSWARSWATIGPGSGEDAVLMNATPRSRRLRTGGSAGAEGALTRQLHWTFGSGP